MRAGIHPADRKILIGAAVALVVLSLVAFLATPPPGEEETLVPTSYSSGSGGTRAAFLLLKDLGYDVRRWEEPPTGLAQQPAGTTYILAEPHTSSTSEERIAIHTFVRRGGRVIHVGGRTGFLPDPPMLGDYQGLFLEWSSFPAMHPSAYTAGAPKMVIGGGVRGSARVEPFVPLYGDAKGAVALSYRAGQGEVIWLCAATPLTNAGITRANNLDFLLNAVGPPGPSRILWDEYFHGYQGSLWGYLARTPMPWALAQAGLMLAVVIATFSRRRGPVFPPVSEPRLSPVEFVETLGGLYHRARAAGPAVAIAYRRFRYLLAKRLGLSPSASPEQLYNAARDRIAAKQPGLYETMLKCDRVERVPSLEDDATALSLVQALEHYTRLLKLEGGGPGAAEKSGRTTVKP